MVEHFYVNFSCPIAPAVFQIICGETDRQTSAVENPTQHTVHTPPPDCRRRG